MDTVVGAWGFVTLSSSNSNYESSSLHSTSEGLFPEALELTPTTAPTSCSTSSVDSVSLVVARAFLYDLESILAEMAWNQLTKLFVGVALAPITILTSPPATASVHRCSSTSHEVSHSTSLDGVVAGSGFEVTTGFNLCLGFVS